MDSNHQRPKPKVKIIVRPCFLIIESLGSN